ncbi:MAG: bile acid:sodium symporter family protein [Bacteroidales bacterium]|nr:bile acid:sodium symporter family protein [Bacteroidales bacterium]
MYEELQALDSIRINFSEGGLVALNITLGIIMFGVALGIRLRKFKTLFLKKPKMILVGLLSQFIALPAFTFLLTIILKDYITEGIALGMILVSAAPGGNISNFISSLAKGSVELSISLTAIATLGAVILTPFNFAFWGGLYIKYAHRVDGGELLRTLEIDNLQMFQSVFILLGIPLILGMLFAWKYPKITEKIKKPIQTVSVVIFLLFVIIAFAKNFDIFILYIKWITVIVLIHNALALLTGFSIASMFGIKRRERRSITIETGIQNSGLALVLLFNPDIFPDSLPLGGMMFIAAWWGIWHMISGLGLSYFFSKVPLKHF